MPKLSEPTSGTDAYEDAEGKSIKHMATSPAYEHLMHKSHPAYKGSKAGFKSCGTGVCMTSFEGGSEKSGRETMGGKYRSGGKNHTFEPQ